ncbi:MAG: extracellular solute-binding protein [Hyphomonas sp.]|nr:extracellular solute-binding protein [Hyphomonas sp.]
MTIVSRRTVLRGGAVIAATVGFATHGAFAATRELEILHTDPQLLTPFHERAAAMFVEAHPDVRVNLRVVPSYNEALAQTLRDGLIGSPAHVAFHGLNNISLLSRRGLLVQLDDLIAREPNWEEVGYAETVNNLGKADGKTWAVPLALAFIIAMYNRNLVEAAGFDPDNFPTTWDGLYDLAEAIEAPSGGVYFRYQSTGNVFLFSLFRSFGAEILSDDRQTILFNSPESLEALRVLHRIGEIRGGQDMAGSDARQAFSAGALGILIDSSSGLGNYQRQAGDRFSVGTAPMPLAAGDDARILAAGNAGVIQARDDGMTEFAWEYLKLVSEIDQQKFLVNTTGYVPVNDRAVSELADFYAERPAYRTAPTLLPYLTGWEAIPGPNSLRIDEAILDEAQKVVRLETSPEDALESMYQAAASMMEPE